MSTTTTNALLVKPDGPDLLNRVTHFNDNWDNIDSWLTATGIGAAGASTQRVHLRDLAVTPSYTGTVTKATLDLQPTWNTTGAMYGVRIQVTHSLAAATSRALIIQRGSNTIFDVDITTNTAVNGLSVVGSSTGNAVNLKTIGADSNVGLTVDLKGSGAWTWTGDTDVNLPLGDLSVGYSGSGGVVRTGTSTVSANFTVGFEVDIASSSAGGYLVRHAAQVAHGMTTHVDTDICGRIIAGSAADGGLDIQGYTELTDALTITARSTVDDTTKSTAGHAHIFVRGSTKTGTTTGAMGANANIVAFANHTTTRFILDGDGDSHQDVGTAWTNFDSYEDTALLNVLADAVARPEDPIKDEFHGWLTYNRSALEDAKLVTFNDDGHHFVNMSKLTMLLVGAMRQQGEKLRALEARVTPLLTA